MDINELKKQYPDEAACRSFFESIIWSSGRICPHCGSVKSWAITGNSARDGLYECSSCSLQFTVTTRTPMHSTKLPLLTWLTAMYLIASSSKGVSSVVVGRLIGTTQKTAWKLGHAIRVLMAKAPTELPLLMGVVELDEKYLGGKPRFKKGVKHKGGGGTAKQCIAVWDSSEDGNEYRFITNAEHLKAEVVAELYKKRWQIELFFKWIKQNVKVKVKTFLGTSENAVQTQLWIAMCVYLLLAWLKFKSKLGLSTQ